MQPGPLLFERSGDLVWTLLALLFIGLVVLVILNMQFAVLWAKMLYIPRHYLYARGWPWSARWPGGRSDAGPVVPPEGSVSEDRETRRA